MAHINLTVEGIPYKLFLLERKSFVVSVHPDKSVVVKAPQNVPITTIERWVGKRGNWIRKQVDYFNQHDLTIPKKCYVNGEKHLYLGKEYPLNLQQASNDKVLIVDGMLKVTTKDCSCEYVKNIVNAWRRESAERYFTELLDKCWDYFDTGKYQKPVLTIRDMRTRWGSISDQGKMTLNLRLIQTPRECIEYVIFHEFCHLKYHSHGVRFYQMLSRTMPEWVHHKDKLETFII